MAAKFTAEQIRACLAFDVERLRVAARRLESVDGKLVALKRALESRVEALTGVATRASDSEIHGSGTVHILYAKAQATAQLARRAALGEVLQHAGRLSLIASMAVSRWVGALVELGAARASAGAIKAHVDTGRLAHRMLATLRPQADLRSGCGQLASAAVVAEFVTADDLPIVHALLEEGLFRGRRARGVESDHDVLAAASRALRTAAELLEHMAQKAEPAAADLLAQADAVEQRVEDDLAAHQGPKLA